MVQIKSKKILTAFINAFAGLTFFFRHERNGRIQLIIGLCSIILGTLLRLSQLEWIAVLICIGAVLSAEMLNSALEKFCDFVQPLHSLQIKIIKDLAAGAVLFISLISATIGTLIFLPKLWQLL